MSDQFWHRKESFTPSSAKHNTISKIFEKAEDEYIITRTTQTVQLKSEVKKHPDMCLFQ